MNLAIDPRIKAIESGLVPLDWATRSIFVHGASMDYWGDRTQDAAAVEGLKDVVSLYAAMIHEAAESIVSFISLGAAGGAVDCELIRAIGRPDLQYIPVDISRSMCELAIRNGLECCKVPMGIVGDFEGGMTFIRSSLAPANHGRKLISCTGNAIGNLDLGESNFFSNIAGMLNREDRLLLSVATGTFGGEMNRARFDAEVGWLDLSKLLASGIMMITGEDRAAVEASLDRRLAVRAGTSDIPLADTLTLWDRDSKRSLLHLRRYDFSAFKDWAVRGCSGQLIDSAELHFSGTNAGLGVMTLRR